MNDPSVSYAVLKGSTNLLMKYYFITILIQQITVMFITGKLNILDFFFLMGMYSSQVLNPCLWGLLGALLKLYKRKMEILLGLSVGFNPIICDSV